MVTPCFVCLVYLLPWNIFFWVLFSFYRTPKDRTKLVLNLHSWKTIYLKIIAMFLSSFWCTTFIFLSLRWIISSGSEKIFRFLLFELVLRVFFAFIFWCFLKCYPFLQKNENSVVFGFVLSSEVKKLTRFCVFNFLTVCHTAKKKYNFLLQVICIKLSQWGKVP